MNILMSFEKSFVFHLRKSICNDLFLFRKKKLKVIFL